MCGIIASFTKRPVKQIRRLYENQKTRGKEGFGFVAIRDGKLVAYERSQYENDIFKKLAKVGKVDGVIFHHRFPTSTPNYEDAAHPIRVSNKSLTYDYYVVHNGVISNDDDLKPQHNKLGFDYETEIVTSITTKNYEYKAEKFNDSEALAIELARYLDGKSETIAAEGSMAFIVLQVQRKTNKIMGVFYGRNNRNPLVFQRWNGFGGVNISSVNNEGNIVNTNTIFKLDINTKYFSKYSDYELAKEYNNNHYGTWEHGNVWDPKTKTYVWPVDGINAETTNPRIHQLPAPNPIQPQFDYKTGKFKQPGKIIERSLLVEDVDTSDVTYDELPPIEDYIDDDEFYELMGEESELKERLQGAKDKNDYDLECEINAQLVDVQWKLHKFYENDAKSSGNYNGEF